MEDRFVRFYAIVALALIGALGLGVIVGAGVAGSRKPVVITRTDTAYVERVMLVEKPLVVERERVVERPLVVYVKDSSGVPDRGDTLAYEHTHWAKDSVDVWASGYDVSVDSVRVQYRERTITTTQLVEVERRERPVSIYATAYGGYRAGGDVGVGAGVEWRYGRLHLWGEGGYRADLAGGRGGYGEAGVKFDIIRLGARK